MKLDELLGVKHLYNKSLEEVQKLFSGNIRMQEKGKNKTIYNWYITCYEASDFLKTLLPFLKEKKKQAELAIYFHENKDRMCAKTKEKHYKRMMLMKKVNL